METMTYTVGERVARITLDRPEHGNGLTRALIDELAACVERADLDPAVHVILLSGNGKGFCGGYDLVDSAEGLSADGPRLDGGAAAPAGPLPPAAPALAGGAAAPAGSPLDPAVQGANHDPSQTWDPMVDYA